MGSGVDLRVVVSDSVCRMVNQSEGVAGMSEGWKVTLVFLALTLVAAWDTWFETREGLGL